MFDVKEIRKDFPMLQGVTMSGQPLAYLDNGATTFKPQSVIDAVVRYYTKETCNAHRGDYELSAKVSLEYDNTRKVVGKLLNCLPKEVVFTSGASMGLNMAAYAYCSKHLEKGDVIVLTLAEHASNTLPWFRLAKEYDCEIRYIPLDSEGRITIENYRSVMDEKVKVVAFAAVTNVLGYLAPVKEMCQIAHEYGAITIVDGAQAVPHMKVDVKDWDCDFLAFSAHKMCGPTGIGVLYGKYDLLEDGDPVFLGGGSNARFNSCGLVELKHAPTKYEAGTPPIEGVLGLKAAVEYIMNLGFDAISKREHELHKYMIERLESLDNVTVYNKNADAAIAAFTVKDVFSQDAAAYLSTKGVAVRSGNHCAKMLVEFLGVYDTLRASLYFYNTEEEIDQMIEALKTTTVENAVNIFF